MKPLEAAARFAAFTWYSDYREAPRRPTEADAREFARENWQTFIPVADEGWGKLILRVAKARPNSQHASPVVRPPKKRQMGAAVLTAGPSA